MKYLSTIFVVLLAVTSVAAEETTFNKVLKPEIVARIVDQASKSITETPRDENSPKTVVEPRLRQEVIRRAGDTALTIEDSSDPVRFATGRLLEGVTKFFHDYRDFVIKAREVQGTLVILTANELSSFLESVVAAKQCGQIPCSIPPCCGNCHGCEPKK